MQVSLTIIRYPRLLVPFAFFAMVIHRFPLWFDKKISFFKLMGSGRNGTFDKKPDLRQWAILSVYPSGFVENADKNILKNLYGGFISGWLHFFNCETFTILLIPIEGHGFWDGKKVFGEFDKSTGQLPQESGVMAVLTRASIRLNKLKYFWQHVAPVAEKMPGSKGFIMSVGIGEIPWIKQATFSIWETAADMKAFAYGMKEHVEVIKKTRQEKWYKEDMFVRFKIIKTVGSIRGINPLKM
ncbi:MAG: spheroidene monooxygenase [Ferruginibacter sp.]